MPHFKLITNLTKDKIPKEFCKELTTILSKTVGKPESAFVISIIPDQIMTLGGNNEPCAVASLMSIGKLGPEENISHSNAIFEKVFKDLGIPKDKMMIEFNDVKAFEVGFNGTTVEALSNS